MGLPPSSGGIQPAAGNTTKKKGICILLFEQSAPPACMVSLLLPVLRAVPSCNELLFK